MDRRSGSGSTHTPASVGRYQRAWQGRRVLAGWQAADEVLRRSEPGRLRDAYESAVSEALAQLTGIETLEQLLAHHARDRYRRDSDDGEPPSGTVEAWMADVLRAAERNARTHLDPQLIEGAAFWRRASQLLGWDA